LSHPPKLEGAEPALAPPPKRSEQ